MRLASPCSSHALTCDGMCFQYMTWNFVLPIYGEVARRAGGVLSSPFIGKSLLLPIYGDVARRAGGDEGEARPDARLKAREPPPEQPASLRAPPIRRRRSRAAIPDIPRCL